MRILWSNPLYLHVAGAGGTYGHLYDYLMSNKVREKGHEVEFLSGILAVSGIYGKTKPPESLEHGTLSDLILSFDSMMRNVPPEVFLGCGCASLSQMKEILYRFSERTSLITTWFSSHYANANRILLGEHQKLGYQIGPNALDPFLMWRDQWEQKYSDALIVPSEFCKETYEADPICKGKVYVANFGVDSNLFHPAEQKLNEFRVLFAGGNWIRKGLHYLIRAWNSLQLKDGVLSVLGVTELPVQTYRTAFLGWVPDQMVPDFYRASSVFVLPTLEEGQALANLEAMASGLPVITTKESGAPIEDGVDGLIVPSRDAEALKGALQRLHDHPNEIESMGKKAREKAEGLTWEKFGEAVLKICEQNSPAKKVVA